MIRALLSLPLVLLAPLMASAALAYPCTFHTECFESDACAESTFVAEVLLEDEAISTEFGDLTIVAAKQAEALTTIFATGNGAEYLLSVSPTAARLSTHMNDGPLSVTYHGICEGAF